MPSWFNSLLTFISSPSFEWVQWIAFIYFGLLWLSIIIWVTRDSFHRSASLLFQSFAILINLIIPIFGILLYLLIRPPQTLAERYYEGVEQQLLQEALSGKKHSQKFEGGKKKKTEPTSSLIH